MKASDIVRKAGRRSRLTLLSSDNVLSRVDHWIPTGCPPLDHIMGGGVPVGRIVEIYGDTSTGKTILGSHILAETQRLGGVAVLLDTETAVDKDFLEVAGVDVDNLVYSNPDVVEDVWQDIQDVIKARNEIAPDAILTIVWDSIAATSSEEELKKIEDEGLSGRTIATHARLISTMCRAMKQQVARESIAFIAINQIRSKIGVMYGDKTATFGGKAISFYSSVRLQLSRSTTLKDRHEDAIGILANARVVKSRVAPPFGMCKIPIMFGTGIDAAEAVRLWMAKHKMFSGKGRWKTLKIGNEECKFQRTTWPDLYYEHEDAILDIAFGE